MPVSIAIQVQAMGISDSQGEQEPVKQASSYIPRSNMPQAAQDNTDWMSSSCGETPFLNDDIRDWRHFRLRVRKGNLDDHLEADSSTDSGTIEDDDIDAAKGFGDFYFNAEGGGGGGRTRSDLTSHLSSSVPVRSRPKFEVGSCPAVVINLPSLTPVSNPGSELMKQNAEARGSTDTFERTVDSPRKPQKKAQEAANNSADDDSSIFDLEM